MLLLLLEDALQDKINMDLILPGIRTAWIVWGCVLDVSWGQPATFMNLCSMCQLNKRVNKAYRCDCPCFYYTRVIVIGWTFTTSSSGGWHSCESRWSREIGSRWASENMPSQPSYLQPLLELSTCIKLIYEIDLHTEFVSQQQARAREITYSWTILSSKSTGLGVK